MSRRVYALALARRDVKGATQRANHLERVRAAIIRDGGSLGWLKAVTTDCLVAGCNLTRARRDLARAEETTK